MKEQQTLLVNHILPAIKSAITSGSYDFTSKNSIIIYTVDNQTDTPPFIEIKWGYRTIDQAKS